MQSPQSGGGFDGSKSRSCCGLEFKSASGKGLSSFPGLGILSVALVCHLRFHLLEIENICGKKSTHVFSLLVALCCEFQLLICREKGISAVISGNCASSCLFKFHIDSQQSSPVNHSSLPLQQPGFEGENLNKTPQKSALGALQPGSGSILSLKASKRPPEFAALQ